MRHYGKSDKSRTDWEIEMLDCLEEARRQVAESQGPRRSEALKHYRAVLRQFNGLVLEGMIPPEEPCYR